MTSIASQLPNLFFPQNFTKRISLGLFLLSLEIVRANASHSVTTAGKGIFFSPTCLKKLSICTETYLVMMIKTEAVCHPRMSKDYVLEQGKEQYVNMMF